uniref:Uncharacterized protein n=1 Tax=Oryza meridionalis TaxID=40149 RepID=A0A0E0E3I8_9ORYZ
MPNTAQSEITSHAHVHAYGSPYIMSNSYNSASCDVNDYGRITENSASKHLPPHNFTTYRLSPAQPQSFGIEHIPLPKPSVNNFQQNRSFVQSTTHKAEVTHRTNDIKLAGSVGGQFVEDFGSKIDNLIEEICRDVEEKMNAYILSKGSKPLFNQQRKPINLELSANEKKVAMLDFSGNIGPFVLPAEFRAKEVDEHLDDGARNRDDKAKRTNQDIIQVKKSECFSNTLDKADCVLQLQESHMPRMTVLIKEIGLGGLVGRSLRHRRKVVQQGSKSGYNHSDMRESSELPVLEGRLSS